jgi:membrane-associated protease RseP (regulator of RpoE activity)
MSQLDNTHRPSPTTPGTEAATGAAGAPGPDMAVPDNAAPAARATKARTTSRPPALPAPGDQRAALVRLLLVIGAAAIISVTAGVSKTVIVVVAILLMIVLHELGHFVMAKLAGIKVTEFFVGFGTRLWSVRKGETEYGVKILPLGGYVKIIGMNSLEEIDPADEPRTYRQQPFWRRISVAVAGSAMHFLIALVLLFSIFAVVGDRGFFGPTPGNNSRVTQIDALATGPSPAQEAGFQLNDQILSVDGQVFKTSDDLIAYIHSHPEQTLDFEVRRHSQIIHLHPTTVDLSKVKAQASPGSATPTATQPTGFVGFVLEPPAAHYGVLTSLNKSGGAFVDLSARSLDALGGLVSAHGVSSYAHMLVNQKAANAPNAVRFESPVGIVVLANHASQSGLEQSLFLLVLINIFVGIFNMIPLLPLDGGHVAIAVYEAVRSRKGRRYYADAAKLMPFVYAMLAVIVFIGVSALFLDLRDVLSVVRF